MDDLLLPLNLSCSSPKNVIDAMFDATHWTHFKTFSDKNNASCYCKRT